MLEYARQTSPPAKLRFLDYTDFLKGFSRSPQLPLSFRESDCHQEEVWEMVMSSLTFTATSQLFGILLPSFSFLILIKILAGNKK